METIQKKVTKEIRSTISGVEVRNTDDSEEKVITGYAAKYNTHSAILRDWWGDEFVEEIAVGAFDEALRNNTIKAYLNHNTDICLGSTRASTLSLQSDNIGLKFDLNLPNTQAGNDLYESVKRGDIDGVSFGFRVKNDIWSQIEHEGKQIMKRTLLEIDLFEISPTPCPAYEDTEVDCRSLEKIKNEKRNNKNKKNRSTLIELMYT